MYVRPQLLHLLRLPSRDLTVGGRDSTCYTPYNYSSLLIQITFYSLGVVMYYFGLPIIIILQNIFPPEFEPASHG